MAALAPDPPPFFRKTFLIGSARISGSGLAAVGGGQLPHLPPPPRGDANGCTLSARSHYHRLLAQLAYSLPFCFSKNCFPVNVLCRVLRDFSTPLPSLPNSISYIILQDHLLYFTPLLHLFSNGTNSILQPQFCFHVKIVATVKYLFRHAR